MADNGSAQSASTQAWPMESERIECHDSQKEEAKLFSKHSPDVSRLVTLKEGQTLSALCYEIYGDPLLVGQVARYNNLSGYRNIPAGTEILMPMLKKE